MEVVAPSFFARSLVVGSSSNENRHDLDLAMPRLNGAESAAVLKNDMPETPVILFTMTELHVDYLCAASDVDFISKVDGIPKLLDRVDAWLPPTIV
jgi:CheY-like chemotaxis protein